MKKKFKLFATIGSLALAVCMMTIGVLAATQVSFSVTSNVGFTVESTPVTVTGKVEYGATSSRELKEFSGDNFEGTSGNITSIGPLTLAPTATEDNALVDDDITGGTTVEFGNLTFANEKNNTIVYTFTIKNESTGNMYVKIEAPDYSEAQPATYVTAEETCTVSPSSAEYNANGTVAVPAGETVTYTLTLTITNVTQDANIQDVDFTFTINNAAIE